MSAGAETFMRCLRRFSRYIVHQSVTENKLNRICCRSLRASAAGGLRTLEHQTILFRGGAEGRGGVMGWRGEDGEGRGVERAGSGHETRIKGGLCLWIDLYLGILVGWGVGGWRERGGEGVTHKYFVVVVVVFVVVVVVLFLNRINLREREREWTKLE